MRDQAPTPPASARQTDDAPPEGVARAAVAAQAPAEPKAKGAPESALPVVAPVAKTEPGAASPSFDTRAGQEAAHPGVPLAPPGIPPESDVRTHSPSAAQPHHHPAPWSEDLGELPWGYGDGRLIALLRDPRTLFVYWDFSAGQVEQAFHGLGTARALLKVFAGGDFLRDAEVHLDARGWYLRELPSGSELRVELWAVGERGARLVRAARPVRLPPDTASSVWDEIYLTIPPGRKLGRGEVLTSGQPLQWRAGKPPEVAAQPPMAERMYGSSERANNLGGGAASGSPLKGKE